MSFQTMVDRLIYQGGPKQQDRMIRDKLKSLLSATRSSYQTAHFQKYPEMNDDCIGLFNPNINNLDYDTKIISVPFDYGYQAGDIAYWRDTDTLWIIYSWERTELAYFRGKARRCDFIVSWVNKDRQKLETPISVIGPNTPVIQSSTKHDFVLDIPNGNLKVLVPNNEQNVKYFNRYQTFLIKGVNYQIQQVDNLSLPGVIQLDAKEYYPNTIEDDVENDVSNAWNIHPIIPKMKNEVGIIGPDAVKPYFKAEFEAIVDGGRWSIAENESMKRQNKIPAEYVEEDVFQRIIHIVWNNPRSGAYTLIYALPNGERFYKYVIVESLM